MSWRPPWQRVPTDDPLAREAAAERVQRTAAMVKSLRDARIMRGLSTADVERDTRINRGYIDAIEEGRFETLPAPVYARGFVRSYARYLGLDPVEAVDAMPQDLPVPMGLEPMPGLRRTAAPVLPTVNAPIAGAVLLAVVLVLAAAFALPRLAGESGVDLPGGTGTPVGGAATATTTPGDSGSPATGATVPPFEEGEAPDFSGVTRAEAQRVLDTLGVTPVIVEAFDSSPAGLIFDQSPAPGSSLREGDVMTLFVSQGP